VTTELGTQPEVFIPAFNKVLEHITRRHYIHNPTVAAFLIRKGQCGRDLAQRQAFYKDKS
jgi:hypothetical protein